MDIETYLKRRHNLNTSADNIFKLSKITNKRNANSNPQQPPPQPSDDDIYKLNRIIERLSPHYIRCLQYFLHMNADAWLDALLKENGGTWINALSTIFFPTSPRITAMFWCIALYLQRYAPEWTRLVGERLIVAWNSLSGRPPGFRIAVADYLLTKTPNPPEWIKDATNGIYPIITPVNDVPISRAIRAEPFNGFSERILFLTSIFPVTPYSQYLVEGVDNLDTILPLEVTFGHELIHLLRALEGRNFARLRNEYNHYRSFRGDTPVPLAQQINTGWDVWLTQGRRFDMDRHLPFGQISPLVYTEERYAVDGNTTNDPSENSLRTELRLRTRQAYMSWPLDFVLTPALADTVYREAIYSVCQPIPGGDDPNGWVAQLHAQMHS